MSTRPACLPSTIAAMGWIPPQLDRTVSVVAGATVYVTGRSTVAETAAEVSARGGLRSGQRAPSSIERR